MGVFFKIPSFLKLHYTGIKMWERIIFTPNTPSCNLRKTRRVCPGWQNQFTFLKESKNPLESVSAICILSNMNPNYSARKFFHEPPHFPDACFGSSVTSLTPVSRVVVFLCSSACTEINERSFCLLANSCNIIIKFSAVPSLNQ